MSNEKNISLLNGLIETSRDGVEGLKNVQRMLMTHN